MGRERASDRTDPLFPVVRFGAFELDVRAAELRKHGIRIRLQEQPFQVLLMLLERPGEVVLRDEIRKKLWPNDTIVEFAPSINAAIQRLRDALTDSADEPRYVETVARRGYRFIGELVQVNEPIEQACERPAAAKPDESSLDIRDLSARTISHFRLFEKLGSGGMGVVYRAHDTKLGRDVALKLLPEEFAGDADRMARLEREAQVLASLNHPNIGAIYGMEEPNGIRALVMELVEGPTLAERIARGPIPIEEALDIARQIGDALQTAHDKGIVHRDLKPPNVKITPHGTVKLIDFGLAALAQNGCIMGTPAYMSPEQARGEEVDKRADIWAFGVVLYQMIMGQQLFEGETITDVLAAVVSVEPEWERVPTRAQRLLRRCLEKNPAQRLRDIGDAKFLLDDTPKVAAAPSRILAWAAAAAVTLIAVVALGSWWRFTKPLERPLVRLDVDLGGGGDAPYNVILSPDGTRLVYVSGTPPRLYTRRLDQANANDLPGTEEAEDPFFSPDGGWVGFFTGSTAIHKLNKISVEGGAVVPLADVPLGGGGSWGSDGNIIMAGAFSTGVGLRRVSANGGTLTNVLDLAPGDSAYLHPQVLPGGKAVLFVDYRTHDPNTASIDVFSLVDRSRKTLLRGSTFARYLPDGHLIYTNKATLFAIPFDLTKLETRGFAVPVVNDVAYSPWLYDVDMDFAPTGILVYRRDSEALGPSRRRLQWMDRTGLMQSLPAKPDSYSDISISPDGKLLAFIVQGRSGADVWEYDPRRDAMTRLTFGDGLYFSPNWSPDGRYLVFGGPNGMYWTRSDGAGQRQVLIPGSGFQFPWSFTPDGKRLAFHEKSGLPQIWTLPLEERNGQLHGGTPERFLKSQFSEAKPLLSPDGHWLAYESDESGKPEVYVREFSPPLARQGGKWQVSNSGGGTAFWSRAKRELLYRGGPAGDRLMSVSYSVNGDSFIPEKPRVWLAKLPGTDIDLAPDGEHFAVLTPVDLPEASKAQHNMTFLFNFFDELHRRVPVTRK